MRRHTQPVRMLQIIFSAYAKKDGARLNRRAVIPVHG